MANVQASVDAVDAMKGVTITVRLTRYSEFLFRTWLGLTLIRLGLWITGTTVVVECEDDDVD